MNLAKVLGSVVATRKEESLEGLKLLVLGIAGPDGKLGGGSVIAVDAVGAGEGEFVLYASGSSARQTRLTDCKPVDAVVMAIVDSWDVEGEVRYRKGDTE
ncbi:MAG TPA: EutN/CcmL family microcompartment protein [Candidatus Krumholzibacteria bacterium]|nr:EutN/CcmL family microcompartment protein [Candidatus Krumholzibacteria bacterium]HPD71833.1 EutN/CcmL family microcompartment protein [Candidatus Krumholzibacteria bacterium]HRY41234.1 EutN/CcmL family microcompartment protein [Candidatus Krumholzibacteria bacterium]